MIKDVENCLSTAYRVFRNARYSSGDSVRHCAKHPGIGADSQATFATLSGLYTTAPTLAPPEVEDVVPILKRGASLYGIQTVSISTVQQRFPSRMTENTTSGLARFSHTRCRRSDRK